MERYPMWKLEINRKSTATWIRTCATQRPRYKPAWCRGFTLTTCSSSFLGPSEMSGYQIIARNANICLRLLLSPSLARPVASRYDVSDQVILSLDRNVYVESCFQPEHGLRYAKDAKDEYQRRLNARRWRKRPQSTRCQMGTSDKRR